MDCRAIILSFFVAISACSEPENSSVLLGEGVSHIDLDFVKKNWVVIEGEISRYEAEFCRSSDIKEKMLSSLDKVDGTERYLEEAGKTTYLVGTSGSCLSDKNTSDVEWTLLVNDESFQVVDWKMISE